MQQQPLNEIISDIEYALSRIISDIGDMSESIGDMRISLLKLKNIDLEI